MKIVTWNVNSLNARVGFVEWYLDAETPDVLCIQELKLETDAVPRGVFEDRGYHLEVFGQKAWNGVAIASRSPLSEVERGLPGGDEGQSRLISATTAGIRLVNLYCPQGQRADSPKFPYKLKFYDTLIGWLRERYTPDEPFGVLGDMNIAPKAEDIYNPAKFEGVPSFHPEEHRRWAQLLELGFEDVVRPHLEPGQFSFWDYRFGAFHKNLGMRIDHILGNPALAARVEGGFIDRDARKQKRSPEGEKLKASDHAPVGIVVCDTAE